MYRIRRFGIRKTATVVALMYLLVFLLGTLVVALVVALAGSAARPAAGADIGAAGVGGVLIGGLVISLFYAAIGWILTAIACALYNVVAGWVGGIEVQVESVVPPAPPPAWGSIGSGSSGIIDARPAAPPPTGTPSSTGTAGQLPWSSPGTGTTPASDTAPHDGGPAPRTD